MLRFRRLFEPTDSNFAYPMSISSRVVRPSFALRPFREADEPRWQKLRTQNHDWLEPWNASDPQSGVALSFTEWVRSIDEDAHEGKAVVLAMVDGGEIVGEVSLGAVAYGRCARELWAIGFRRITQGADSRRLPWRSWRIGPSSRSRGRTCTGSKWRCCR